MKNLRPGKQASVLKRFALGQRFHRFQAEDFGDHCLHSTVSTLQKKHGIYISRKPVRVPNRFGSKTRVMLYWLEGSSLIKAKEICGLPLSGQAQ